MCLGGRLSGRCCSHSPNMPTVKPMKQNPIIVPLTGAAAFVQVVDFCARVTIKQRYENKEKDPIEAVYEFPLDPKAAIHSFYAEIDDKRVIGTVQEKEDAEDSYSDAISSGHGAYLLKEEKDRPTVFSCSVGNLPPGKEVMIVISYVTELEFDEGKLVLVLPANPFEPDGKMTTKFELPSQVSDGKYSKEVGYGLKVDIDLDMTSNIKSISSPTNPITFEFGDTPSAAHIKLAHEEGVPLSKDFLLHISLQKPHEPIARLEQNEEGRVVVMVGLFPDLKEDVQVFTEMIFLVDRSGSMSGSRINAVKETLHIFLRSLPEGTLFNIIGFGTSTQQLFPNGSQEYNDKTLAEAVEHVNKMSANLGGTNILQPLQDIFQEEVKEGIPRQVFVLTDGEVENTQLCIDEVRFHANTTRVFTFGIGSDASIRLIKGMAKAGEGQFEMIQGGEDADAKVMRQLTRAMKPALTELRVDWSSLSNPQQTPYHLPPLFGGGRLIAYGILPSLPTAPTTVMILANTPSGPTETTIVLDPAAVSKGVILNSLAAKSMIRDLEEGRSYLHNDKKQIIKGDQKSIDQKIIKLSTTYSIMSKLTAFVAVEKRGDATEGTMQLRKISMQEDLEPFRNFVISSDDDEEEEEDEEVDQRKPLVRCVHQMRDIIKLQKANGSFTMDSLLQFLPNASAALLKSEAPSFPSISYSEEIQALFITAIVCAFLRIRYTDQQVSWNLVVKKAQGWIKRQGENLTVRSVDWDASAVSFIEKHVK